MKPGYLTTEFWTAAASQLLSLLVILGVITGADRTTLEGALTASITAVGTLVASAVVVWQYIASRTTIKTQPPIVPAPPQAT